MVAVVLSGVIGRFVYIQIPRTIEGRELTLTEVKAMKMKLSSAINSTLKMDDGLKNQIMAFTMSKDEHAERTGFVAQYLENKRAIGSIRKSMKVKKVHPKQRQSVIRLLREEISLSYKIKRLQTMQRLFKYWHVAHLPFALIMAVILIIHVAVTLSFGYKWIF
ncbi:MAG: hypothetical protein C0490_09525 [Marivirga sp.]|nr:hypothetical protein [Marivirga sp.]